MDDMDIVDEVDEVDHHPQLRVQHHKSLNHESLMNTSSSAYYCNFKKVDITPEGSVFLAGFANRSGRSDKIHSRLYSHCMVVGFQYESVCIISNDLLDLSVDSVGFISKKVSDKTGLPQSNIFIHSIHTHSAPSMAEAVLKNPENRENILYKDFALRKIIDNAVATINNKNDYCECRLKTAAGTSSLGICRRTIDPHTGMAVMGKSSVSATGLPLNVAEFEDVSGKPYLTIINYPCHPVTLNETSLAVSSDFAGAVRDCIEKKHGSNAIFFNGAAGDINPCYPLGNDQKTTEKAGQHLCLDIEKVALKEIKPSKVVVKSKLIFLPFNNQNQTEAFIDREVERKSVEKTDFINWPEALRKWGDNMKQKLREGSLANYRNVKISAVKIGKLILFFSQGEIFSRYQEMIRDIFPHNIVMFIGYTDGKTGYLPDYESFKDKGYEVEQAYVYVLEPSPLNEESCMIYIDEAGKLIASMTH